MAKETQSATVTQVAQSETLERIARRVVREQFPNDWEQWRNLTKAIEAALRNERERAVRLAANHECANSVRANRLARAIREGR